MLSVRLRKTALALAAAVALASGCKDLSQLTDPTSGSSTATITLWTSDSSPSYIAVAVDGSTVGTLTAYRYSAPACGAQTSGGTITVPVSPGQHVITAYETSSSGTWGPSTVNVDAGKCLTFEFTP